MSCNDGKEEIWHWRSGHLGEKNFSKKLVLISMSLRIRAFVNYVWMESITVFHFQNLVQVYQLNCLELCSTIYVERFRHNCWVELNMLSYLLMINQDLYGCTYSNTNEKCLRSLWSGKTWLKCLADGKWKHYALTMVESTLQENLKTTYKRKVYTINTLFVRHQSKILWWKKMNNRNSTCNAVWFESSNEIWGRNFIGSLIYIQNRSPTTAVQKMTPYELWTDRKQNVKYLCVFRCSTYVHIPKIDRSKMDFKAKKIIFLGYGYNMMANDITI